MHGNAETVEPAAFGAATAEASGGGRNGRTLPRAPEETRTFHELAHRLDGRFAALRRKASQIRHELVAWEADLARHCRRFIDAGLLSGI